MARPGALTVIIGRSIVAKKPKSSETSARPPAKAPSTSARRSEPTKQERAFAASPKGRLALGLAPRTKS
jgi:hypothetical protein